MRGISAALLALTLAVLACALPTPAAPTAAPVDMGTSVALTFQALTGVPAPATDLPPATVAAPPTASDGDLLPRALYYLADDEALVTQVYRLGADGKTLTQITREPILVNDYDVSALTGQVVYVSGNKLLLINGDGSGRRVLVDGGPAVTDSYAQTNLGTPRWSPDGTKIAFARGGLNFYDLASGGIDTPLVDQVSNPGFIILNEGYAPQAYSPDGSKLLVRVGYYEGGSLGIYVPSSRSFYKFNHPSGGIVCCVASWSSDSQFVYVASPALGMIDSGLWRFDAATGSGATLIGNPSSGAGPYVFADAPYLAPDGQLYFFYATYPDLPTGHTRLKMVRSAPDGATGRVELSAETMDSFNEALWSPDARSVVLAVATAEEIYQGGELRLYFVDGGPWYGLVSFASNLKWGP
ncbi:MAG: TolB family protein [Chloroflexota bacterium]